ncbi:hypothetical protein [Streptomyces sp. NPDC050392]|uniref:hypothetical protein n=1 Tax=Streptomyces sp. NPDC050392 TaxID=3155782 RepID=UPI0034254D7E
MRFHITRTSADSTDDNSVDPRESGATVTGGVFGGVNHGIQGGVFHGRIKVTNDDDE